MLSVSYRNVSAALSLLKKVGNSIDSTCVLYCVTSKVTHRTRANFFLARREKKKWRNMVMEYLAFMKGDIM